VVRAKVVVCSAGALHTPALLLRSGFRHPQIGRHLGLHPVLAVMGVLPEVETGLATGVGMGVGE
jgi:choline dehydrogenase-like flavoprotein